MADAHTEAASIYAPLQSRPVKNTICLFDVDGTLTPARLVSPHQDQLPQTQLLKWCSLSLQRCCSSSPLCDTK